VEIVQRLKNIFGSFICYNPREALDEINVFTIYASIEKYYKNKLNYGIFKELTFV